MPLFELIGDELTISWTGFNKVQVGKIDLDTCGALMLVCNGVVKKDQVEVLRGQATEEDLANLQVLCIEVGGNGRVKEGNFDHHGMEKLPSATMQAWETITRPKMVRHLRETSDRIESSTFKKMDFLKHDFFYFSDWYRVCQLVEYIDKLDTKGPGSMPQGAKFPTLSDVFSGMLLTISDPKEQLRTGAFLLGSILVLGIDPFGQMPRENRFMDTYPSWQMFIEAKEAHDRKVEEAVQSASWDTTKSGLKLAYLETDFIGALGALYDNGAQIAIAFSPNFGPNKIPKFSIGVKEGEKIRVDSLRPELNSKDPGWGGPPTGTIIGSPREVGSKMSLQEVVDIVRKNL
ncbi:MAG: hypothetical protein Q8Q24_00885 [bacterium]|nr:hypothetical protein [bacterium]